jgi:alpha 1,3-glucosidase
MAGATCAVAIVLAVLVAAAVAPGVDAVDRSKFRKCEHTSFCRDHRPLPSPAAGRNDLVVDSLHVDAGTARVTGEIRTGAAGEDTLTLEVQLFADGRTARVRINEHRTRWQNGDVVLPNLALCGDVSVQQQTSGATLVLCDGSAVVALQHSPMAVHLLDNSGNPVVSANARNRLYFEQSQTNAGLVLEAADDGKKETRTIVDWGEDGAPIYADESRGGEDDEEDDTVADDEDEDEEEGKAGAAGEDASKKAAAPPPSADWAESFGGHTDQRPHGPQSVGMDVFFPMAREVYVFFTHTPTVILSTSVILLENTAGTRTTNAREHSRGSVATGTAFRSMPRAWR